MSYTAAICTRGLSKDYGAGHGLFDLMTGDARRHHQR